MEFFFYIKRAKVGASEPRPYVPRSFSLPVHSFQSLFRFPRRTLNDAASLIVLTQQERCLIEMAFMAPQGRLCVCVCVSIRNERS